jgi:L-lactate utilization protein LutC
VIFQRRREKHFINYIQGFYVSDDARKVILQNIQHALHRSQSIESTPKEPKKSFHISFPSDLTSLFIEKSKSALALVEELSSLKEVPAIILRILKEEKLEKVVRVAEDLPIQWQDYPELKVHKGPPTLEDNVSVTQCLCGVAETGTLVLLSSRESPTTLYFLPSIHIVLLNKKMIVGSYEEAIQLIRTRELDARLIHFITGPSRTADIEQTVEIGMHGPKKIYVLLWET